MEVKGVFYVVGGRRERARSAEEDPESGEDPGIEEVDGGVGGVVEVSLSQERLSFVCTFVYYPCEECIGRFKLINVRERLMEH